MSDRQATQAAEHDQNTKGPTSGRLSSS